MFRKLRPKKIQSVGSGSGTVEAEGQIFQNPLLLELDLDRARRLLSWVIPVALGGMQRPALARIQAAGAADAALANYPGIDRVLKKYLDLTSQEDRAEDRNDLRWDEELVAWAALAQAAQKTRGKARFAIPKGFALRVPVQPGDQLISLNPVQRWGSQYFDETRFEADEALATDLYGTALAYPLTASGAHNLTLLRMKIAGLQEPNGSSVELGIHPDNFGQRDAIEIIRRPPREVITESCGALGVWMATQQENLMGRNTQ